MKREIKTGIISVMLAIASVLIPYPSALAQSSGTITITMTGAHEISITVSPATWSPVDEGSTVAPNTEYKTDLAYFISAIGGNCAVYTYIAGTDATWLRNGKIDKSYMWTLSENEQNGVRIYALWFKVQDTENYIPITKAQTQFYSTTLGPGDTKRFGLKLLTPQPDFIRGGVGYFSVGDDTMQTRIIISAVAA